MFSPNQLWSGCGMSTKLNLKIVKKEIKFDDILDIKSDNIKEEENYGS